MQVERELESLKARLGLELETGGPGVGIDEVFKDLTEMETMVNTGARESREASRASRGR